jgi:hypothetical protein
MSVLSPEVRIQLDRLVPQRFATPQRVTIAAALLILAQLAFRAWAAFGGFFFVDDFKFLSYSRHPISLDLLMTPHDGKLMPGGLLVAWFVAHAGPFAWPAAAISLIVMQALASVSAWIMLRTLFGDRWAILPLLGLYLFAPITLTAFMWWAAAINLIPMQIAMFLAVATHVKYLSTGRVRWAILTALSIMLAMAFYQKSLLIYPVIVLITIAYFAHGGVFRRPMNALRRWWPAWVLHGVLLAAYLAYTTAKVPSPVSANSAIDYPGIIGSLVFKTFMTTIVGGPWRWSDFPVPPAVQVDPPLAVIVLSTLLIGATVGYALLMRSFTWPAWVLVASYVVIDGVLLSSGRGLTVGVLAAPEPRYVSDAAPVVVLALGLAFLPLRSEHATSSAPRATPLLTAALPRSAAIAIGLVVAVGCAVSSTQYVGLWHDDFAARTFVDNVSAAERRTGDVVILDAEVPPEVLLPGLYPYTLPSRFFNGSAHVQARKSGTNLDVLDAQGIPHIPVINDGVATAAPESGSCGALYSTDPGQHELQRPYGMSVTLSGAADRFATWMAISYLASGDGEVAVRTGTITTVIPLLRGPNTFFMRPPDDFRTVAFVDLSANTTLCVSSVKVGHLKASEFS